MSLTIITNSTEFIDNLKPIIKYIEDEINVANVNFETNIEKFVQYTTIPNHKNIGARLKKTYNKGTFISNLILILIRFNEKISRTYPTRSCLIYE